MILREATAADLPPLLALCKKVWTQLSVPYDTSLDRFRRLLSQRFRIVVLYDGEKMLATLIAHPLETDHGPAFEIHAFVVDQTLKDKTRLLDALSLYALNIAMTEGRRIVLSHRPKAITGPTYGPDKLGMTTHDDGTHIHQAGHAPDMMHRILDRHPEWQLP